jgi:transposase-like protein
MAAQKKYPDELRERAVKMLFEVREREGKGRGELARVARQLGASGGAAVLGQARGNRRRDAARDNDG